MKRILGVIIFVFCMSPLSIFARDLTYKFGAGYRLTTVAARVSDDGLRNRSVEQLNGLELHFGIAKDLLAGAYFGFNEGFGLAVLGPRLRYDVQRLISRDAAAWKYLNIFVEGSFLFKFGRDSKAGITIQAPYLGFEVFPFESNDFAILTSAGPVMDFGTGSRIGFTKGLFGDAGVRYYF